MEKINITKFFESINYNWQNDLDYIKEIALITKTRIDENKHTEMPYGIEQTFLIKSIAKNIKANNFYEIGSGRGTASFAVSLEKSINSVYSFDKFPRFIKQETAINYRPARVSLNNIKDLIPFTEKTKIKFRHIYLRPYYTKLLQNKVDLCFIDGNHDDYDIVMKDFLNCLKVVKKNKGIILFDDYFPNQYIVRNVVQDVLQKYNFKSKLIEFRGHIFENGEKESNSGIVMMETYSN